MIPYDYYILYFKKRYDRCLEILEKEKNKSNINEVLYKKAEIYYELAKIENDINHLNEAESFINQIDDNNKTDNEYAFLASIYNEKIKLLEHGKDTKEIKCYYKKSIEYYKKAIKFLEKIRHPFNNKRYEYIIHKTNALHNLKEIGYYKGIKDNKIIEDYKSVIDNSSDSSVYESAIIGYYNALTLKLIKDNNINNFFKILKKGNKNIINIQFIIHRVIIYLDKIKDEKIFEKQFNNILNNISGINYIWEKEKYFNSIVSDKDKNEEKLKELWILQYMLLDLLSVKKKGNIKDISTYMSIYSLKTLTKNPKSKLKMFSISKVNDIKEGKMLYDILNRNSIDIYYNNIEDSFAVKKKNMSFTIVQESFTRLRDSLTMFRLYGKNSQYSIDDKDEGTGVCLVFNKNLFDTFFYHPSTPIADEQSKLLPIYFILYYNKEKNKLIFNPTSSDYQNIEVDLNEKNYEWNNEENKDDDNLKLGDRVGYIFNKIFKKLENDKEILNKAYRLLINIQYLIKDSAFVEEQEMRILRIAKLSDSDIYYDEDKDSLCKEYVNIFENDALREIIIGPKVKEPVSLIEELQNAFENDTNAPYGLKFTISKSPLA